MRSRKSELSWSIAKRQFAVASILFLVLGLMVAVLYLKDRQREWRLRTEQSAHRLELAYELIARDLERVRSDILFVASQPTVREFNPSRAVSRGDCESTFSEFLRLQGAYQQIRLIDQKGHESIRVDLLNMGVHVVPESQLQDKKDRYYVVESLQLSEGSLFVSEFDLNQEHGEIENPLNPVIRFVTPVVIDSIAKESDNSVGQESETIDSTREKFLLVANYKGAPLLNDLAAISLPGATYLIRTDGQFLLGPEPGDGWGWLLGHDSALSKLYPTAWKNRMSTDCVLTASGAFAFRQLNPDGPEKRETANQLQNNLLIVSHLPADEVFATSRKLLLRLILILAAAFVPLLALTRYWAKASFRRESQAALIRDSERKLRELSKHLVKIQEEERRSISREIHDQFGQQATAINLDLKLALRETKDAVLRDQLKRIVGETDQLLDGLHDFATRVRPVVLDDLGLVDALESHLWEFSDRSGINVNLETNLESCELAPEVGENVFRLVQESLNNVLKHANATSVVVVIKVSEDSLLAGNGQLEVKIQDDGIGLPEPGEPSNGNSDRKMRLGILGMQERVDLLKGTVSIESGTGVGTTVLAQIPIQE